jgi:vancomycin permeability regulator SanA
MQKPGEKYKSTYLVIISLMLLNLVFIYLLKYYNQNLSLTEFNLFNTGNLINLIFIVITVSGILILLFRKEIKEYTRILISLTIIVNLLLLLSALTSFISLPLPDYYVFDYHISRVIVGVFFGMYQFMIIVLMSSVWFFIFGYRKYLFLRTIINSAFVFALLFVFSVIYLNLNNRSSEIDNSAHENIGVVLGAAVWSNKPSPSLSSRADKAAMLLNEGKISKIQLTGSNAPGELSEAEMAYNYLSRKNVPMDNVFMENMTRSTNEQIRFIKTNLYNSNSNGSIVIISDSYHLARIKEICRFQKIDVDVVASDLIYSFRNKLYYNFREAMGILIFWLFAL